MKAAFSPSLWERALCLLFPARCLQCARVVSPERLFCAACEKDLPEQCFRRRFSQEQAGAEGFLVFSPLSREGGFRRTLNAFKFEGQTGLAGRLGQLMADALPEEAGPFDCVTWVPMSERKKQVRGYDQSQLLAKAAGKFLRIPCVPLLEKVRENRTQHSLSKKERQKNVKRAYRSFPAARGKAVLLVDDIVTTGATLRECAGVLYKAGAKKVVGLCAADTPGFPKIS